MAWPGNFGWNNHGSGVDHAPPPPRDFGPFANPEFWQRLFEERRGWDEWGSEHPRGPHGRAHSHGFGRRGGRRHGGRRGHGPGGEGPATDSEEFPPEYIDDEEVAAAVAEEEMGHEHEHEHEHEKDQGDEDTTMRADTPDTEASEGEGNASERKRGPHGRHGRHGSFGGRGRGGPGRGGHGRGGFGRAGFGPKGKGEHRRHGSGPRGFHHHGPPPPPPFFDAMFGGGPGPHGPHGPHDQHHGPPPPAFFEEFFGAGPGPRGGPGGPHGRHHHGPPPPPFGGFFGGGPGPRGGPGGPGGHHPPRPASFFEALFGAGPGPHSGPGGHHPPPGPHGPPPPPEGPGGAGSPFDFSPWIAELANHPYAQTLREYLERAQGGRGGDGASANNNNSDDNEASFTPPLDLFEQKDRWVLHMAVPGARKEDVGVSWDADRSVLRVSGVVHRAGDEEFLSGLVSGERRTGPFAREVRLPPQAEGGKEEVNAEGIEAKMEDGILVITVCRVEKGWTEVKKVDIQ